MDSFIFGCWKIDILRQGATPTLVWGWRWRIPAMNSMHNDKEK